MSGIFNIESPLMRMLNKISDLIIISVMWFLLCIPIVTIGAATTAAYYTVVKVVKLDRGTMLHEFFKSFKQNFRDSVFVNIVLVALQVLLAYNIFVTYKAFEAGETTTLFSMLIAYVVLLFMVIGIAFYTYAFLSRFTLKGWKLVKFAMFANFRHFPSSILLVITFLASGLLVGVIPVGIVFVPALFMFVYTWLLERILRKYMTKEMLEAWDGPQEDYGLPNMGDEER